MAQPQPTATIQEDADEAVVLRYLHAHESSDLGLLVERHRSLAYRTAMCFCNNTAIAEEAVQEAFLMLTRNGTTFTDKGPGSFRAWFYNLIANVTRTCMRKEVRVHMRAQKRERLRESSRRLTKTGSEVSEVREQERAVAHALGEVEENLRIPIILHVVEGLPQSEVGQMIGISQSQVSRRIEEGLEFMRRRLAQSGFAGSLALLPILQGGQVWPVPAGLEQHLSAWAAHPASASVKTVASTAGSTSKVWVLSGVGLLLTACVLVYVFQSKPVNGTAEAAVQQTNATKPAVKRERIVLDFNDPATAQRVKVLLGGWKFAPGKGLNGRSCMEVESETSLQLDIPPDWLPLKIQYETRPIPPDLKAGHLFWAGWSVPVLDGRVTDAGHPVIAQGDWYTHTNYMHKNMIDRWCNNQRTVLTIQMPSSSSQLRLENRGKYMLQQIVIEPSDGHDFPNIDVYQQCVDSMLKNPTLGQHECKAINPVTNKPIMVEFTAIKQP